MGWAGLGWLEKAQINLQKMENEIMGQQLMWALAGQISFCDVFHLCHVGATSAFDPTWRLPMWQGLEFCVTKANVIQFYDIKLMSCNF
jgi:hypothetical protein